MKAEAERMKAGRVQAEFDLVRIKSEIKEKDNWSNYYDIEFAKALNRPTFDK
jgi:hypothetical protein